MKNYEFQLNVVPGGLDGRRPRRVLELGAGQQRQEVVDGGVLRQQRDRRLDQQDVEAAPPHLRAVV